MATRFVGHILILAMALAAPGLPVTLAQGGKAEPKRIAFNRGASSASVTERIRGAEEAEYILGAQAGQEIILELDASSRSLVAPGVSGPDGQAVALNRDRMGRWRARLDQSGDYNLVVKKNKPTAKAVRYTLKVRIPPG